MMQKTHSPGPWKWWTSCSFRRLSSQHDGDVLHATIQRSDGHPDITLPNGGWEGPDGRLIEASPELLSVVRRYVTACEQQGLKLGAITGEAKELLNRIDGIPNTLPLSRER